MSSENKHQYGYVAWTDLTVPDAPAIRDFYEAVAGWKSTPVRMGDYDDFNMTPPDADEPAAGICHARGLNERLPAQWLIYILVEDLDESIDACRERGGQVISGPRDMGAMGRFCVIEDPAGAVAALFTPAAPV